MPVRIAATARNAGVNAIADLTEVGTLGAAVLQIYSGVAPAAITDPPAGNLLLEYDLPDPAFDNAPATAIGVAALQGVPIAAVGQAAGDAGYARMLDQDGAAIWDTDDVGTVGQVVNLSTVTVSVGLDVNLNSCTLTMPAGSP